MPSFHVDVGVAGDPEEALFLHVLLTEDEGRIVEHQLLRQGKSVSLSFRTKCIRSIWLEMGTMPRVCSAECFS